MWIWILLSVLTLFVLIDIFYSSKRNNLHHKHEPKGLFLQSQVTKANNRRIKSNSKTSDFYLDSISEK